MKHAFPLQSPPKAWDRSTVIVLSSQKKKNKSSTWRSSPSRPWRWRSSSCTWSPWPRWEAPWTASQTWVGATQVRKRKICHSTWRGIEKNGACPKCRRTWIQASSAPIYLTLLKTQMTLGKESNNQNGNLRWHLPWRGGGVSRGSRVPFTYFEKWFF